MKVIDIVNDALAKKETRFAFELLPPLKGENIGNIFATVERLARFDPAYINITYHREEVKYVERADGLLERRVIRKRPGTVSLGVALKMRYNIEVVPHLICGGFSKYDTEDALIELNFLGIHNVLALRGDAPRGERAFKANPDGYANATGLVKQIAAMNRGEFVDSEIENCFPTEFCIGVAGYPEKHIEAPNRDTDIAYLKAKVDAGADYIVTQMFFDNAKFFAFVEDCRKAGINVPIIPGLKPFSTRSQLSMLPQIFHVDLPEALVREIEKCKTAEAVREAGIEWAIAQSEELKAAGVPILHFYSMGKADNIEKIAAKVF